MHCMQVMRPKNESGGGNSDEPMSLIHSWFSFGDFSIIVVDINAVNVDDVMSRWLLWVFSQMLGQSSWLEDVGHSINDRTRTTLEVLYRLINSGMKLERTSAENSLVPFHGDCVAALNRLRAEMDKASSVEKRAAALLTER